MTERRRSHPAGRRGPRCEVRHQDCLTGLAELPAASIDVVITDLGMPYVDGRQVIASVRATAAHTPIILLTGWGKGLDAEGAPPPHVDRVLGKPPRMRELRVALAEVTRT